MCGLIAWIGRPIDAEALTRAVARRGPHEHGWAVRNNSWLVIRSLGGLTEPPLTPYAIGHSRLATSGHFAGGLPSADEAQPLVVNDRLVAHNGVIELGKDLDSAQLLYEEDPHRFLELHGGRHALITANNSFITASSTGQPLFKATTKSSIVISSVPVGDYEWHRITAPERFSL